MADDLLVSAAAPPATDPARRRVSVAMAATSKTSSERCRMSLLLTQDRDAVPLMSRARVADYIISKMLGQEPESKVLVVRPPRGAR